MRILCCIIASWCNGSTTEFGSVGEGSNPSEAGLEDGRMGDVEKSNDNALARAIDFIATIQDSYTHESDRFADFIWQHGISPESIHQYIKEIEATVIDGRHRRYSVETYNKYVKAMKNRIRALMEHETFRLGVVEKYQIEKTLESIPLKRIHQYAKEEDEIPTVEEMRLLLQQAPKRLSLIMEFILFSGARISEALNVMVGDIVEHKGHVTIRIAGKGGKQRSVYVPKRLYSRIMSEFDQFHRTFLFQHSGRQYNRKSVTNEIRRVSGEIIGKKISAHDIRHRIGTDMTREYGLWSAADYLGHSSITVTQKYYNSNKVSAKHIKDLYGG